MILIAPDKFKGTLSAREAADIIAKKLSNFMCIKAPMADGGEGTAAALCSGPDWQPHDCYFSNRHTRTAVIDSSAVIGLNSYGPCTDILQKSSAPLGLKVREILKGGCDRVIIGIGGTGCCDGGVGFLEGLGIDKYHTYKDKIIGLSDVQVPLLPTAGRCDRDECIDYLASPSALTFAPQKGATAIDMPVLYRRLLQAQRTYGHGRASVFDGAGGGLGFAIATAIGAPCFSGAEYVLKHYGIDWSKITCVVTGEGKIDSQTSQGKVVSVVAQAAADHGIPCIAIGGTVEAEAKSLPYATVSTTDFYPELPLDKTTATKRLSAAADAVAQIITRRAD